MGLIYAIDCADYGTYVGSTIHDDPNIRWNNHKHALKRGKHSNHRLQDAWDTYGETAFTWRVVEPHVKPRSLIERERAWYTHFKTEGEVFNQTIPGGRSSKGYEHRHDRAGVCGKRSGKERQYIWTDNWW